MHPTLKKILSRSLVYRLELLRRLSSLFLPEYRFFKWPQMTWWQSKQFSDYLRRFGEEYGYNADRRWMVSQLLRLVDTVPGDTAEVGCYRGAMSWLICQANDKVRDQYDRFHHIFDSFEGLSTPGSKDGDHWKEGALCCGENLLRAMLSDFIDNLYTYKGWVPERFNEIGSLSFAFVHIDVDLYLPTLRSLEFFYPRLSPGAILVCDDYGFTSCPGATIACNEYLKDKPEAMIQLADGGGFIIKGLQTASETFYIRC